jgi:protein-arginine kinase activator protein McsA
MTTDEAYKAHALRCVVCSAEYNGQFKFGLTCCQECHDRFLNYMVFRYGEFKRVIRQSTGEAFKVPVRDIIEHGIKEQDLDRYPKWEQADTKE